MQRIDDYLNAVRFFLPRRQKNDILRELSENLREQVADREEKLGRRLTRDEEEELLKQYGHPMLFALRYGPDPPRLIGPVVFPFYWLTVKIVLIVMGLGYAASAALEVWHGAPVHPLAFLHAALPAFGWITFEFALYDYIIVRFGLLSKLNSRWDPRSLPATPKREARPETIYAWIARAVFTVWWLVGLQYPVCIFGPGAAWFTFGPGLLRLYPLIFVLSLVVLGLSWRARPVLRKALDGIALIPLCLLLPSGEFLVALNPGARYTIDVTNLCIWLAVSICMLVTLISLAWEGAKYFQRRNYQALGA